MNCKNYEECKNKAVENGYCSDCIDEYLQSQEFDYYNY